MPVDGRARAMDGIDIRTADPIAIGTEEHTSERLAQLEREVAELRDALATRQLIGWVAGMLAERFGLGFEEAWNLMVRLSQNTNVKLREVARVIADAYCGALSDTDTPLARELDAHLGKVVKVVTGPVRAGRHTHDQ